MKSILCFALLLTLSLNASTAQTLSKGSWTLGGGLLAEQREALEDFGGLGLLLTKRNVLALFPQVSYFAKDNLAIGVRFLGGIERSRPAVDFLPPDIRFNGFNAWGTGAFIKYYHPIGGRFYVDVEVGGNYRSVKNEGEANPAVAYEAFVNPGISFFFNSKWVLQGYFASAYYVKSDFSKSLLMPEMVTGYGINFGAATLAFRLNYFFGKEN